MSARTAKEIRPLIFPWVLAVLGALVILLKPLLDQGSFQGMIGDLFSLLIDSSHFIFVLGIWLVAAMPFGVEFQHRTMVLLLGQPEERFRIWRNKMLITGVAVATLSLLFATVFFLSGNKIPRDSAPELVVAVLYGIAVVCSSCFWTLIARSTVGGMVFTSTMAFVVGGITAVIVEGFLEPKVIPAAPNAPVAHPHHDLIFCATFLVVGLLYAAIFLWLGWRKFARLEMRDAVAGQGISLPRIPGGRSLSQLFRSRSTSSFGNLLRKEVWLHRILFGIAAIFTAGWLLTFGAMFLLPVLQIHFESRKIFETIFNVLTVAYIPLLTLLAGCISQAEEKSLGLAAWHLTLPIPSRRSWLLKFSVAAGLFVLFGLVLPYCLSLLTSTAFRNPVGLASINSDQGGDGYAWIRLLSWTIFGVSFWSASFSTSAVRAIVTTVSAFVAVLLVMMFADWCANQSGGLLGILLSSITAFTQSQPVMYWRDEFNRIAATLAVLTVTIVCLKQSLAQFRRGGLQNRDLKRSALMLGVVIFVVAFLGFDSRNASSQQIPVARASAPFTEYAPPLVAEVHCAVDVVLESKRHAELEKQFISVKEMAQTGKLSWLATTWLRNAEVTVTLSRMELADGRFGTWISGMIILPGNKEVPFGFVKFKTEPQP